MKPLQRRLVRVAAAAVAVVALTALPTGANASLIGDSITITSQANFPLDIWTDTVVVGAGIELAGGDTSDHANTNNGQNFADLFTGDFIDVGATTITINYAAIGDLFGFPYGFQTAFTGLDWTDIPGTLTDVTLASGAMGLSAFNISGITPNSFVFQGTVDLVGGANFTLDLVHTPITAVPIPAALPLFLSALGGLGLMGWRRRRRTAASDRCIAKPRRG